MKETKVWIFAITLSPLILSLGCSVGSRVVPTRDSSKPVFDQEVGSCEDSIVRRFGEPAETCVRPSRELGGELRSPLKTIVEPENTMVKELYYKSNENERVFWLTYRPSGEWRVVSDVEIPAGWAF